MAEILVQKSRELNFELNAESNNGYTAYCWALHNVHLEVDMVVQKSAILNLNLNAKNKFDGMTAFHIACRHGHLKLAGMFVQISDKLKLELNAKGNVSNKL